MFDRVYYASGYFDPAYFSPDYKPRKKKRRGGMSYEQALAATLAYRRLHEEPIRPRKRTRRRRQVERMAVLAVPAAHFPMF